MNYQNSILIVPLSNGFLVILPKPRKNQFAVEAIDGIISPLIGMIKNISDDDEIDPIIKKAQDQQIKEAEKLLDNVRPPLKKDENSFIFKTLDEVLVFISETYPV